MDETQFIWSERYRPTTLSECIFPERLTATFKGFVEQGGIPNLLLCGGPGVGKTTVAKCMINDIGANHMMINASLWKQIDILRTDIQEYASTVSLLGGRKYVILDELDATSSAQFQPALRAFMDEFSKYCGFIATANYPSKLIEPLLSRFTKIDFTVTGNDATEMAPRIMAHLYRILVLEGVQVDKKVLVPFVKKWFPDIRRMLSEMQYYALKTGQFDAGILVAVNSSVGDLVEIIKRKKYTEATEHVLASNLCEGPEFYTALFDARNSFVKKESVPEFIDILADYQYKENFVANKKINTLAMIANLMARLQFQ
jgi:replication factor C small subunit